MRKTRGHELAVRHVTPGADSPVTLPALLLVLAVWLSWVGLLAWWGM